MALRNTKAGLNKKREGSARSNHQLALWLQHHKAGFLAFWLPSQPHWTEMLSVVLVILHREGADCRIKEDFKKNFLC